MTRISKPATELKRLHCYKNKSEWMKRTHSKHHYRGAFQMDSYFLRFLSKKKKFYQMFFLSESVRQWWQWVAPETPSTEDRLAEVVYPFPFPSGCLALHRMPATAQRSRCRNSDVTHHPEDRGVHHYSSVRHREKSTTPLFHESVLCHRAVRMLIQRPRGDHLLLCLDLAKNKQLHWTKRLGGSQQGLSGQTAWLPEYEAAPPPRVRGL